MLATIGNTNNNNNKADSTATDRDFNTGTPPLDNSQRDFQKAFSFPRPFLSSANVHTYGMVEQNRNNLTRVLKLAGNGLRYPVTISSTKQFRPPGLVSHFEPTTLSYLLKMNSSNLCKPPTQIAAKNNRILEALTRSILTFLQRVATNVLFVTASSATILTPENEESSRVTDVLKLGNKFFVWRFFRKECCWK